MQDKQIIVTAHQPAYLPWLGLFHKIALADFYVYLDNVQFEKNSFINRNKIKTPNGAIWLTVPVKLSAHTIKSISQIRIDNSKNWKKDHWKSISLNYGKTKYFKRYADFFENIYNHDWQFISKLNEHLLRWLLEELSIKTKFILGSTLNIKSKKSDLILDICKKLNANIYISGSFGKNYLDENKFKDEKIKIYYQNYHHPIYKQLYDEFLPNMSILDLLLNIGPDSLRLIKKNNIDREKLLNQV